MILSILLAVFLLASAGVNIWQYTSGNTLRRDLDAANGSVSDLQKDVTAAQEGMTQLEDQLYDLESENDSLRLEVEDLENQLTKQPATPPADNSGPAADLAYLNVLDFEDPDNLTGLEYHTHDCKLLDSQFFMALSPAMAQMAGLTPCKECH